MNHDSSLLATERSIPLLVETCDLDQFALFPSEHGGGVTISNDEILQLSCSYSKLYATYIFRLSAQLESQFDIAAPAASLLARSALVPLIHCFMDRLVRVKKAIDCAPGQLTTPRQELFPATDTIEAFEGASVANPAFNQSMVWFVGRVWQLPESDPALEHSPFEAQFGFKNNMFRLYPRSPWKLVKRFWHTLLTLLPASRFPTLSMANATGAFLVRGFYFSYLKDVSAKWSLVANTPDELYRESLFSEAFIHNAELDEFLKNLGLNSLEQERTRKLLSEFLRIYYPSNLLEAIPENMQQALKVLQPFKKTALFTSGGQTTRDSYMVAAAKQMGLTIVGHQHGGQYGYINDISPFLELEYPGLDQFVSWGWTRLPDHPVLTGLSVIKLPSPWLSERKRYWKGLAFGEARECDFLLMSNMVKRFPAAPVGASTLRIDLVQEFAKSLKDLVLKVTKNNLSIIHKPYNPTTVKLLSKTMEELKTIGGRLYYCEQQLDKGLTYELLKRCSVVLWDHPGTGLLECLSSKIPTMVYWPRIHSQEEAWLKALFLELEQAGIVHRDVESLTEEMQRFKLSPAAWMHDVKRVSLVNRFCREFAWTSSEWPEYWRRYLDGLPGDNNDPDTCHPSDK